MGLLFPDNCLVCGQPLVRHEHGLCMTCIHDAPINTLHLTEHPNPMENRFLGHFPVAEAWALWTFRHDSRYRNVIHDVKYHGNRSLGIELGRIAGREIRRQQLFMQADCIVPIPLHWRRRWKRGYNQSDLIARGMAEVLGIRVCNRHLKRTLHNATQTHLSKEERQDNVQDIFDVSSPEELAGKHILLIDDVCTTGATLTSAAQALRASVQDITISIFTIYCL